jgi:hypothetical protein
MAFSQFSTAQVRGGKVVASGPVTLDGEVEGEVAGFLFALVQGDVVVGGPAQATGGGWQGEASAGALEPGEAQGVGVMLFLNLRPNPGYQVLTWSEAVQVA